VILSTEPLSHRNALGHRAGSTPVSLAPVSQTEEEEEKHQLHQVASDDKLHASPAAAGHRHCRRRRRHRRCHQQRAWPQWICAFSASPTPEAPDGIQQLEPLWCALSVAISGAVAGTTGTAAALLLLLLQLCGGCCLLPAARCWLPGAAVTAAVASICSFHSSTMMLLEGSSIGFISDRCMGADLGLQAWACQHHCCSMWPMRLHRQAYERLAVSAPAYIHAYTPRPCSLGLLTH